MRIFWWISVVVVASIEILVLAAMKATAWSYIIAAVITIGFLFVLYPLAREYYRIGIRKM